MMARIAGGCGLAALTAVMVTLSFAPHDVWPLVWVGFVPMLVAQHRVLPPRLSGLALGLGVGGFFAGIFGGMFPAAASWYMKALPVLVGATIFLTTRGERARLERTGYAGWPLQAGLAWVVVELLRSLVPALGTWGFLGYTMYRQAWFIQPVAVVGMFGLDLLIVVVNYALAILVIALLDRRHLGAGVAGVPLRVAARWCAGVAVAVAVWCASSLAMRPHGGATVRIAALQPGLRSWQLGSTPEARERGMLALLSEQTRRAASQGARLVVWPEAALTADPRVAYRDQLAGLAREARAYLFVGYVVETPAGRRNEALAIGPDGAFLGTYGKDHPVVFLGGTSISRGTYPTYETPFGTVGAIICADLDFTDSARRLARRGAKVIAVPSADWAAIGTTHYVHAVFRALETGAAVAKSEYSRGSAIVDGSGVLVASAVSARPSAAVLVADVALHTRVPLAARLGDWVGWLCAAWLLVVRVGKRPLARWPPLFRAHGGGEDAGQGRGRVQGVAVRR
jgi:apolipoprotein N-acyltransferase